MFTVSMETCNLQDFNPRICVRSMVRNFDEYLFNLSMSGKFQ